MQTPPSVADLPRIADALPPADAARFRRIYDVVEAVGRMRVPDTMAPWVERTFGPVAGVEAQRIVRVTNVVTGEAAIFNELRARRPVQAPAAGAADVEAELADDAWARPLESTPEDLFGRIEDAAAVTAANVAKYDALHSILVFREPHPLRFDRGAVRAYVDLAGRWFREAHAQDPAAVYPFFLWNCLWRSGGSIVHGHAQTQLARRRHYARVEGLRAAAARYRAEHGADYFADLARVHAALGLAVEADSGVRVLASLTPVKEKETLILAPEFGPALADALYGALAVFRDALGVRSFNVGALLPPLAPTPESWDGFPVVARVVDRGPLASRTSDIGAMELFAEPVVASDPFAVARALRSPAP